MDSFEVDVTGTRLSKCGISDASHGSDYLSCLDVVNTLRPFVDAPPEYISVANTLDEM